MGSIRPPLAVVFKNAFADSTTAAIFGLTDVVAAFNFQADGTLATGDTAQSQDAIDVASTAYMKNYKTSQSSLTTDAVNNYKNRIADVKNINDFFATNAAADSDQSNDNLPDLYDMALRAYGISPDEMSKTQMKKVLESDPHDPKKLCQLAQGSAFHQSRQGLQFRQ